MAATIDVVGVSIKDSTATGGATFIAYDSTNVSGNTGWTFKSVATAALSGSATATAVGAATTTAAAALTATADLSATATTTSGGTTVTGDASVDATASVDAAGYGVASGASVCTADASLDVAGIARAPGSVACAAQAAVVAVAVRTVGASSAITASATLVAASGQTLSGVVAATATSTAVVVAVLRVAGVALLVGQAQVLLSVAVPPEGALLEADLVESRTRVVLSAIGNATAVVVAPSVRTVVPNGAYLIVTRTRPTQVLVSRSVSEIDISTEDFPVLSSTPEIADAVGRDRVDVVDSRTLVTV